MKHNKKTLVNGVSIPSVHQNQSNKKNIFSIFILHILKRVNKIRIQS